MEKDKKKLEGKEERSFRTMEIRDEDEDKQIFGYAALFDDPADEINGFIERVAPGAFTETLKSSDPRALINHEAGKLLGRFSKGTLKLKEDKKGLYYEINPPETSYANDLLELLKRGDIDQSSFQFTVDKEEWDESGEVPVRTIVKVAELFDVSPVTFPWYKNTVAGVKSRAEVFEEYRRRQQKFAKDKLDLYKKKIKLHERDDLNG